MAEPEAPAAAASFAAGTRVALHGLRAAVLNGALGLVEGAPPGGASAGRVPVHVTCPPAAAAAHAVAALKPENVRPCTPAELARLYAKELSPHLQAELRAASLALQDWRAGRGEGGASEPPEAARLRSVVAQCAEALAYLDNAANALPAELDTSARDGIIAMYAFLLATAAANVAVVCAACGDAQGQLAAYADAFKHALHRRLMPVAAARYGQQGLVQDTALRYGEALRVAGRPKDAVAPLRLAARVAAAEEDTEGEAAAQGTLCSVLLSLSEFQAADAAGEREVALLEAAEEPPAPAISLARAQGGLANVKFARAAAAGAGTPEAAPFAAAAEALAAASARAAEAAAARPGGVPPAEAAEGAEVATNVHTLRGHLAKERGELEAALRHYNAALEAAQSLAARAARAALPTDALVTPHAGLERVHAALAARARAAGAAREAAHHGDAAVRHRRALFSALRKALPTECAVCTEPLAAEDPGADVSTLPCLHVFHTPCIDTWFARQLQGTCPVCRSWSISAEREHVEAYREVMAHMQGAALQ